MPSTLGFVASSFTRQWTPLEASAELWLDADDVTTITQASGLVSAWEDKSGNQRDALQTTGANRPSIGVTTLNGRNVISFNGSSSFFKVADFYAAPANVYAVIKTEVLTGIQHIVRKGFTAGTDSFEYQLRLNADDYQVTLAQSSTVTINLLATDQLTTNPTILGYDWNGSSLFIYENGTSVASASASITQYNATQELRIGAAHSSASDASSPAAVLNGYIAELVIFSGALSTTDRQKLEGYLAHKWGLTSILPGGHPYEDVAPTIN